MQGKLQRKKPERFMQFVLTAVSSKQIPLKATSLSVQTG